MFFQSAVLVLSALHLAAAGGCNADNCYRAVKGYQEKTSAGFCSGYLASATAAPSPFATCGPARLSSACNCLATATAPATTTTITTSTTATTMTTSTTASASPTNLVSNGGFETGALSPWAPVTRGGYFSVTDNSQSSINFPFQSHTGAKFLQMGSQGDGEVNVISQPVSLTAGTSYTFTAYYSVLDLPLSTCFMRAALDATTVAQTAIYSGAGGGNPPRYYRLTGTYVAPAAGTASLAVELWCDFSSLGGVFGLDDVSLV